MQDFGFYAGQIFGSTICIFWLLYWEFGCPNFLIQVTLNLVLGPGILPDAMHVMHLSLYPDAYCSVLLDLTDTQGIIQGTSRDARLTTLWVSYRQWCEQEGLLWEKHCSPKKCLPPIVMSMNTGECQGISPKKRSPEQFFPQHNRFQWGMQGFLALHGTT